MTSLYFVRHGVTEDTGHKLTGWVAGVSLSEKGRAEAEAAAKSLAKVPFKAVFASPIDRTLETAEIVAAPHGLSVRTDESLGEVRYGRWTNRSLKSLSRTKLWASVQRWPSAVRFPDGETLKEVQDRAVAGVEAIRAEYPKGAVCLVSHADVIRLVVAHYLGVHIDLFQRIVVGPGSITVVAVGGDGPMLVALNLPPGSVLGRQ